MYARLRRTARLAGLTWLLVSAGVCAAEQSSPALEAFANLPAQSGPALSPDGHWIAWVEHATGQRVLMFDLETHKVQRSLAIPEEVNIHELYWHSNETLLMVVSATRESKRPGSTSRDYFRFLAVDVSGGEARMLPMPAERNGKSAPLASMVRARTSKPYTVIMQTRDRLCHDGAECLIEVDTRTGAPSVISFGVRSTFGWAVDRDGRPIAREDWDYFGRAYRLYALGGDKPREIFHSDEADPPHMRGTLADGSALVVLATQNRPYQAAWALPLDGSPLRLLAEAPHADIQGVYIDRYSGAVIGVYEGGAGSGQHWLESAAQGRYQSLAKAFPNRVVEPYSWTEDGTKTLARVSSPSQAPVYYLTDFKTHRADIAAEEYPALAQATLGEFQEITYKARDGTDILAYLTLPPVKPSAPVPLVVYPHGGPQARDYPGFDWLGQLLATHGYAVVEPQFRGSSGFGHAFEEAGYRQWGALMQDDLTDAVHALVERGIADPKRVCIIGLDGYSGYAALAGAAFTPETYACAASVNGITELPAKIDSTRPYSPIFSEWEKRIGSGAKSPINSVNSIRIPILMLYGAQPHVPIEQSQKMERALRAAGKSVTVVALPTDTEWWVRSSSRVQLAQELDKFLAANLRPGAAAAAAH
jgi:dipeptidyl aminopeptidase/acylaminoacyl peptidase